MTSRDLLRGQAHSLALIKRGGGDFSERLRVSVDVPGCDESTVDSVLAKVREGHRICKNHGNTRSQSLECCNRLQFSGCLLYTSDAADDLLTV